MFAKQPDTDEYEYTRDQLTKAKKYLSIKVFSDKMQL